MRLVDDFKRAYRWFSVQCMALALALHGAWEMMPDDLKTGVPPRAVTVITIALLALGIFGRLVKQEKKE